MITESSSSIATAISFLGVTFLTTGFLFTDALRLGFGASSSTGIISSSKEGEAKGFLKSPFNAAKLVPTHAKDGNENVGIFISNPENSKSSSMINTKASAVTINQKSHNPAFPMSGCKNATICVPMKPTFSGAKTSAERSISDINSNIQPK